MTLTNNLPAAAGNTSILFPGFQVTTAGGVVGPADPGSGAGRNGDATRSPPRRRERTPTTAARRATCRSRWACTARSSCCPSAVDAALHIRSARRRTGRREAVHWGSRISGSRAAAYDHARQLLRPRIPVPVLRDGSAIHRQAEDAGQATTGCVAGAPGCSLQVATEPYHPAYFLINGRSMPD